MINSNFLFLSIPRCSLRYFCVFTFSLLSSCDSAEFKLKGRNNPNDSQYEHASVEIYTDTLLDFSPIDVIFQVSWKKSSPSKQLLNPEIWVVKNGVNIFKLESISQDKEKGLIILDPVKYNFKHFDYLQVYCIQNQNGNRWCDSLKKPILLYDKSEMPLFSPIQFKSTTKNSAELQLEIIKTGSTVISEVYVCYNTAGTPTINDSKKQILGSFIDGSNFNVNLINLNSKTTYYTRLYCKSTAGEKYTKEQIFNTQLPDKPQCGITTISNIGSSQAEFSSSITNDGGGMILEKGFCYNTTGNPDISNATVLSSVTGSNISSIVTGLNRKVTYYVRSYAKNAAGTSYGPIATFTTLDFTVLYKHNCDQINSIGFNNVIAKAKYWTGTANDYADWVISSNGYQGNCLSAETPKMFMKGGYIQFSYNSTNSSKVSIWILAVQPGFPNRVPICKVDGNLVNCTVTQGTINSGTWMQVETSDISSGTHTMMFEWGDVGTAYNYKVDEITVWN